MASTGGSNPLSLGSNPSGATNNFQSMQGVYQLGPDRFKYLAGHTIAGNKVFFVYRETDLKGLLKAVEEVKKLKYGAHTT